VKGSATYERLRARHERLWLQLSQTEREIVNLIGRASGTECGASVAQSESHAITDRIAAWFPETLREAVQDARDAVGKGGDE